MAQWVARYIGPKLGQVFDDSPLRRAMHRMADKGGDRMHDYIVAFTPIRTGNLATSWYREPVRETTHGSSTAWETSVATEVEYAPYVNYGTGLWGPEHRKYLIEPKPPNEVLSWVDPITGRRVFARHVWHPGSEGRHMVEKGQSMVEATLNDMMEPELRRFKFEMELQAEDAMRGLFL